MGLCGLKLGLRLRAPDSLRVSLEPEPALSLDRRRIDASDVAPWP
jgi:hypothetical protein